MCVYSMLLMRHFQLNSLADEINLTNKVSLDVKAKLQVIKNMKVDTSNLEALSALKGS